MKKPKKSRIGWLIGSSLVIIFLLFAYPIFTAPTQAPIQLSEQSQAAYPAPLANPQVGNDECLACHQTPGMVVPLEEGEELYLTIDAQGFANSIHGSRGYACIQCHTDIEGFPHPEKTARTSRELRAEKSQNCIDCHLDQADKYAQGRHAQGLIKGNQASATCVDCHSSHETVELTTSQVRVAQTCKHCHEDIYTVYQNSVHGVALLEEGNQDVPTCTSCHDSHDNTGPGDEGFVLFSPQICADCHADQELMAKYDINTDVFDTYVADFHGTTVTIFENTSPDQQTNKPVCIDCHGVHDIRLTTDETSTVIKQNLLATCQRCHPDAAPGFPDAWLSHYPPDLTHNPLVYLVDLFYAFVIPVTVGGILLFIITNYWRRMWNALQTAKGGQS